MHSLVESGENFSFSSESSLYHQNALNAGLTRYGAKTKKPTTATEEPKVAPRSVNLTTKVAKPKPAAPVVAKK